MKNYNDVLKSYDEGKYWQYEIRKNTGFMAGYRYFDLSYGGGLPIANYYASEPLVAQTLNGNKGIYKGSANTGQKYVHKINIATLSTNLATSNLMLLDYVMYIPFVDLGTTDLQEIDNTTPLPRFQDGKGLRVMCICQGVGTGYTWLTMNYINQDGDLKSAQTLLEPSAATVGSFVNGFNASNGVMWFNLAQGDYGIRSIVSVQASASVGAICALVIVKPICSIGVAEISTPSEVDFLIDRGSLPKVHNDAYLNFIAFNPSSSSTTSPSYYGYVNFIWE